MAPSPPHRSRSRRLTAALLVFVAALACADEPTRIAEHMKRGQAHLDQGRSQEAVLEFRNVLQLDPNFASAHYGLAKAYLSMNQVQKGYWELQETVRLAPENMEAKLELAQFLLFGRDEELERAIAITGEVMEADPKNSAAWLLNGRALQILGRWAAALSSFEGAVERAPEGQKAGPLLILANFLRSRGDTADAEARYRELNEVDPGFRARAALAAFLASDRTRDDEAEAAYREALSFAEPEEMVSAYAGLANFLWSRERVEDAEAVLREGIDGVGEDKKLDLIYALAKLHHAVGETERATAMIMEATRATPDDPQPFLVLSSYLGRQGDLDGALAAAESAVEVDPSDVRSRLRRAELLIDLGYRRDDAELLAEGTGIVQSVLEQDAGSAEGLFVRAKILLAEGSVEDAESALRRAVDTRPEWARAHLLLGSTLYLQRDLLGSRAELIRALELEANLVEAQVILVRVHAALGDHELAVDVGRRAQKRKDSTPLRVQLAQSLVRLGRAQEALDLLRGIPQEARSAEVHYALGRTVGILGDDEAARAAHERAHRLEPHRYEVLRALLRLDLKDGRLEESMVRVKASLAESPDDPRLSRLFGEVSLYSGDSATAEAQFQRAIELNPNDLESYESLARYLLASGRPDEVVATYEDALARNPESATMHLVVASLYDLRAETNKARVAYENAIRLGPELAVAKNNLAFLLADEGDDLDRALELALEAKRLLPDSPYASDTLGWVLLKRGEMDEAIFHLREAVQRMDPDDAQRGAVLHHLALAFEASGNLRNSRAVVRASLEDLGTRRAAAAGRGERMEEPAWAEDMRTLGHRLTRAERKLVVPARRIPRGS